MIYRDNISAIEELVATCDGVFTTAQADAMGIPRNALSYAAKTGAIERVAFGAYRDPARLDGQFDELRAIWMLTAPEKFPHERLGKNWDGVCACGTTAASLLGIGDFHASPYQFAAAKRINSRKANAHFKNRSIRLDQITLQSGVPTTRVERTLADLVKDHEDISLVADAFRDAIRKYGATTFDVRKLKGLLSKSEFENLCSATGIGIRYELISLDSHGHVALVERGQAD